jgi:uncharacterized DUF497 family protein
MLAWRSAKKHGVRFSDVVAVFEDDDIRIVSACEATRRERPTYEEGE